MERPAARVPLLLIGRDVLVAQDPKHKHTQFPRSTYQTHRLVNIEIIYQLLFLISPGSGGPRCFPHRGY